MHAWKPRDGVDGRPGVRGTPEPRQRPPPESLDHGSGQRLDIQFGTELVRSGEYPREAALLEQDSDAGRPQWYRGAKPAAAEQPGHASVDHPERLVVAFQRSPCR